MRVTPTGHRQVRRPRSIKRAASSRIRVLACIGAVALAGLVCACSSGSGGSSSDGTSVAANGTKTDFSAKVAPYLVEPQNIPSYPPLSRRPPKGEKIYFVSDGSEVNEAQAAAAACQVLGWSYHAITYSSANPAAANSAILSAINAGANAVIGLAVTPSAVRPALALANSRHIPVVIIAASVPTNAPGYSQVSNVNADNATIAKVLAYAVLADAQERHLVAHIALVSSSSIASFSAVNDAEIAAIKSACHACTVNLVDVPLQQLVEGDASSATISYLQGNASTNYVLVNAFPGSMATALRNAGFRKVRIGIFGGIAGDNAAVKENQYIFNINISNDYNSWLAVDSIARALTGGNANIHNAEATPVWIVTPHNVDFNTEALPNFPVHYAEDFSKLWRIS